eukprot:3470414-Pyramimonas_sp.AAC.1
MPYSLCLMRTCPSITRNFRENSSGSVGGGEPMDRDTLRTWGMMGFSACRCAIATAQGGGDGRG